MASSWPYHHHITWTVSCTCRRIHPDGARLNDAGDVAQFAPVGAEVYVFVQGYKDGGKLELSMSRVDQATGQLKPEAPRPPPMPSHGMVDPYAPSHGMVDPYAQMAQFACGVDSSRSCLRLFERHRRRSDTTQVRVGLRPAAGPAAAAGLRAAASTGQRAAAAGTVPPPPPGGPPPAANVLPEPEIPGMTALCRHRARSPGCPSWAWTLSVHQHPETANPSSPASVTTGCLDRRTVVLDHGRLYGERRRRPARREDAHARRLALARRRACPRTPSRARHANVGGTRDFVRS